MSTALTEPQFPTLKGRVAVVTGSSRGIGRGIALELGARGARVVVNYANSAAAAESVVKEIQTLGSEAIAVKADVSDVAQIKSLFKQGYDHFGRIDIVCSNSGVVSFEKSVDVTPEQFDEIFRINARGQFFVAVEGYKYITKNGRPSNGGRIILTSSIAATVTGLYDHALYQGSKCAIQGLVRSLATDFGQDQVSVNAIAPGGVVSDMSSAVAWHYMPGGRPDWAPDRVLEAMANQSPMKRAAYPKDVAQTVAMLVSDDAGWVTGQTIQCAGGAMI